MTATGVLALVLVPLPSWPFVFAPLAATAAPARISPSLNAGRVARPARPTPNPGRVGRFEGMVQSHGPFSQGVTSDTLKSTSIGARQARSK